MSKHDLVWEAAPHSQADAPFLGNGFFGAMFYFSDDLKQLYINLGHTGIYDNRPINDSQDNRLYLTPRLPIGKIAINFTGTVEKVNLRLDIYNARLFGDIITSAGVVNIDCMIVNSADCLLMEHNEYDGESIAFSYIPSVAESPRYNAGIIDDKKDYKNYRRARAAKEFERGGICAYLQPFYSYGGYCVSRAQVNNKLLVCVNYGDELKSVIKDSLALVKKCAHSLKELISEHVSWWNSYYKKSFISLEDGVFESFVYIQLYKLACACRENSRPIDTCGPWLSDTHARPGAWWDMNVELSVSPLYVSNHIEIAHCINNTLQDEIQTLIDNVPQKHRADCAAIGSYTTSSLYSPVDELGNSELPTQAGNLIWILFYCWQEYKITGNESILIDIVYPLLKRSVNYYLKFITKDKYGRLHIKATSSPGCTGVVSPDTNYDIALLRWGCKTLLEIIDILKVTDKDKDRWRFVLFSLADYPKSEAQGLKIAAKIPYEESNAYFSHLLAFYPLHLLSSLKSRERSLAEKSILSWQSLDEKFEGFSYSAAASMYAMLGEGDKTLSYLKKLWQKHITPNTMSLTDGRLSLEAPLSAANAVLEMLIQSHNGYIDIFPSLPSSWENICFDGLMCYDGFEVGARLTDGKLEWIKITSKLGKRCKVKADFAEEPKYSNTNYKLLNDGKYVIDIKEGETAILSCVPSPIVDFIKTPAKTVNCYGLNPKNRLINNSEGK